MADDATQKFTQDKFDPRRIGLSNSGLNAADIADVICILHPCSLAALEITSRTAQRSPQHVLQNQDYIDFEDDADSTAIEEQETFILDTSDSRPALDLALRFSSTTKLPAMGFLFGRNPGYCDIIFDSDSVRRVSNTHFRIFLNTAGVCMLQDMSTNGTMVDEVLLRGKSASHPRNRMLNSGSIIQILSNKPEETVKFVVRIPTRDDHMVEYRERFASYMQVVARAELQAGNARDPRLQVQSTAMAVPAALAAGSASLHQPHVPNHSWGMHWNGGTKYNVVGRLGKGAFALVFQLATKAGGEYYAAKELEKRKFMKNGVLDRKLDNEMSIMRAVNHKNIVKFVEHVDYDRYLYIIMEYIQYGDLQQYIQANGPLSEHLGMVMSHQVFDALDYLHSVKITHRDIKPDNILIANNDPNDFWVKLSDFGLSKVVKDNDTFLKTFCGTLLYCAPEVFPHYDQHFVTKGTKRTRGAPPQPNKFHSYSQSVDVWSFGAVLWYSLCNKPPFEGVLDNTGRGMFERIMETQLDPTPLYLRNVSMPCINLILATLNTDPAQRPTPAGCLAYEWFAELGITQKISEPDNSGLNPILEEEEGLSQERFEQDLSQLSLQGGQRRAVIGESASSSDRDALDPRMSKRIKYHEYVSQAPGTGQVNSRADSSKVAAQPRLFGEIGESALNLALLDSEVNEPQLQLRSMAPLDTEESAISREQSGVRGDSANGGSYGEPRPDSFTTGAVPESIRLMGAESMVRDLNMDSPESDHSPKDEVNEPTTPEPVRRANGSASQLDGTTGHEETPKGPDDVTPKQPRAFSRQIQLPLNASHFSGSKPPSSHVLEHSTSQSGHEFLAGAPLSSTGFDTVPDTRAPSAASEESVPIPKPQDTPVLQSAAEFEVHKPALVARLISTPDSFSNMAIDITKVLTSWGRSPYNTIVYPDSTELSIPKRGIILYFSTPEYKDLIALQEKDEDWKTLPGLVCDIATEKTKGIMINGVLLMDRTEKGRAYGRLHTGDIITVLSSSEESKKSLSFRAEIYYGAGKEKRKPGQTFRVLTAQTTEMKSPKDKKKKKAGGSQ